jgi:hypothetical protein
VEIITSRAFRLRNLAQSRLGPNRANRSRRLWGDALGEIIGPTTLTGHSDTAIAGADQIREGLTRTRDAVL